MHEDLNLQLNHCVHKQASSSDAENADSSSSSSAGIKENLDIQSNISKKKKDDPVVEAIGLIKNLIKKDPVKDMLSYLREEAEKAREHEMKMMQMIMQSQPMQQPTIQQPTAYLEPPGWQYTPYTCDNQVQPSFSSLGGGGGCTEEKSDPCDEIILR